MRFKVRAVMVMVATLIALPGVGALSSAPAGAATGINTINHIVVLMQENRSADNYLGQLSTEGQAAYEAEPTTGNPNPLVSGGTIAPFHKASLCETSDLNHTWTGLHQAYDNGAMDGFTTANDITSANPDPTDPSGSRTMGYYTQADLPFYYSLYSTFATDDRYFASVMGPTFPNRFYSLAATSFGHIRNDFPPAGGWPVTTIFDRLGAAGISWKIYDSQFAFGSLFSYVQQHPDHVAPISQYYTDAAAGNLPQVAFVDPIFAAAPNTETDEHPSSNVQVGQNFAYNVVHALETSPNWPDSAMFLTYDENGGFYDHVAPPAAVAPDNIAPILNTGDTVAAFDHYGFRVPMVVVSPYAKSHYVSHVVDDHTSILKFIETRFGLTALTARDAAADPMLDLFDFSSPAFATPPTFTAPTVTACTAPTVSGQPASVFANPGQTITFSAAATTETTPTVQWQLSVDHGTTWGDVAGLTSASFSSVAVPFANGWQVRARFTNPIGSATTNAATLAVVSTAVTLPSNGATVSGSPLLGATAVAGATQVQFELTGGTLQQAVIGTATPTIFGWLLKWDSTTVPNGTYTLQSVASYPGGTSATSAGVTMAVNNPAPTTTVGLPANGATLTGGAVLGAIASPGVTQVTFELTGGSLNGSVIATATPTIFGWLATFNSASVPNGTYTLQSVASYSGGLSGTSTGVSVTVSN